MKLRHRRIEPIGGAALLQPPFENERRRQGPGTISRSPRPASRNAV